MPQTEQELSINISDELTLTPLAGASLVNEIIKGLLYQKCQLPFPYVWLKQMVEKRRKLLNDNEAGPKKVNVIHENHYRVVSTAYDQLNLIMRGIEKAFRDSTVKEVVIVFGSSPTCPKEVFTVALPDLATGHIERNHLDQLNTHLQKVLRNIFLSQTWINSIDATMSCTNTYIFMKKHVLVNDSEFASEGFESCMPLQITAHTKHSKFFITYNPSERINNCCSSLVIFNESGDLELNQQRALQNDDKHLVWCRFKGFLKGFKDCFINKVSVCDLW